MRLALVLLSFFFTLACAAQVDTTTPPYRKYPTLPPLNLLLSDSSSTYTKENMARKKPTIVMLFSPDCSHCQHEAEQLAKHKEELEDFQIIMATTQPLWKMNAFIRNYGLDKFKNITVGQDRYYILPSFYDIRNLPYHALYNKKGELITGLEGSRDVRMLIQMMKEKN